MYPNPAELKRVIEAALFAAQEPLSLQELKKLFADEVETESIRSVIDELQSDWRERAIELIKLASGWRFRVRPQYMVYLERLTPEKAPRYSRAVMETLAIIAYRQPVTRGDIEAIRGVSVSSHVMQTLSERGWIEVIGHKEVPGRPGLYATTRKFLDDLSLASLRDLPPLTDLGHLIVPDLPDLDSVVATPESSTN